MTVSSARTVTVFNIAGNDYRLISAIHYDTGIVYALQVLTHGEYSKDRWKKQGSSNVCVGDAPRSTLEASRIS